MIKIISVVGARPQFIKLAPLIQSLKNCQDLIIHKIIHTGQHYDDNMSKIFFSKLHLPDPDYYLGVGPGPHGAQTGRMMERIEEVFLSEKPDWSIVYGDTNSTLAGAVVGAKLHIPTAHVEAGLRSFNKGMPEEINRIIADHCAQVLFCPTINSTSNLKTEGFHNIISNGQLITDTTHIDLPSTQFPVVANIGDIMLELIRLSADMAEQESSIIKNMSLTPHKYFLLTLHRAENVDQPVRLSNIINTITSLSKYLPVIFPIHPRTRKMLQQICPSPCPPNVRIIDPVGYFDMIVLIKNSFRVLTDSGGVQKEAFFLHVPCLTLRDETEWVETVDSGWNILTGISQDRILTEALKSSSAHLQTKSYPDSFGSGQTSHLILEILTKYATCL